MQLFRSRHTARNAISCPSRFSTRYYILSVAFNLKEDKKYIAGVKKDEWIPVKDLKAFKKHLREAATKTLHKYVNGKLKEKDA
jgi:hypothetical protein